MEEGGPWAPAAAGEEGGPSDLPLFCRESRQPRRGTGGGDGVGGRVTGIEAAPGAEHLPAQATEPVTSKEPGTGGQPKGRLFIYE